MKFYSLVYEVVSKYGVPAILELKMSINRNSLKKFTRDEKYISSLK